ncbi:MAG TPA: SMI1/KNR4 family protein [Candidatus Acidoferrum sp.]|nr:SMI1/KNR4 family protein [Candidatus Acidoferrum sp.]
MAWQTLLVEVFGPLVVAFALLIAALGIRRILHQYRHRLTPEQHQEARDAFRNRLVHPKAAEVEREMGGMLPQRLLTLYDDHQMLLTEEIEIHAPAKQTEEAGPPKKKKRSKPEENNLWLEAFLPLDMESQKYTVDLGVYGRDKGFCFATDGAGNFYWMPLRGTRAEDAPVFFACHDPFGNEQVARSLEELLSWPRTLHAEEEEAAS